MRLLLLLLPLLCSAQIETRLYPQPLNVGTLTVYAIDVCNGSDNPVSVPGGLVWQQAAQQGVTLALPTAILSEQSKESGPRFKRIALYLLSGLSAGAVALSAGNVIKIDAGSKAGKAYYATLSGVAVAAPLIATQVEKIPVEQTDVDMQRLVPSIVEIPAHRCVSYVHPGKGR